MKITTGILPDITVSVFQRMKEVVDIDPVYQREGDVWKTEDRSRLIDSIINGLDMPKLYFEAAKTLTIGPFGLAYQYAVIDGKQRLGAILAFLSDELALPDEFIFYEDQDVNATNLTLSQLKQQHPLLAQRFFDYELPIVRVDTDSDDLIEEMFQRLNASTSLNAAERRNAVGGQTRESANKLAEHRLLQICSPIRSARYKYRELAAKFLAIEHQLDTRNKIKDTKADTLWHLFHAVRGANPEISGQTMIEYQGRATRTLDRMAEVFSHDDPLLASIGTVVVYYIAFRSSEFINAVDRRILSEFEELRRQAAQMREDEAGYSRPANARLRDYNAFVQSTNDGSALTFRARILSDFVLGYISNNPLRGLDHEADTEPPDQDDAGDS